MQEKSNQMADKDIWTEMKEDAESYLKSRRQPAINEVKRNLAAPRGTEQMFREALETHKDDIILLLNRFAYHNRKKSSQNRLAKLKTEKLIEFAKQVGFIV
jgi:hypothetical protein